MLITQQNPSSVVPFSLFPSWHWSTWDAPISVVPSTFWTLESSSVDFFDCGDEIGGTSSMLSVNDDSIFGSNLSIASSESLCKSKNSSSRNRILDHTCYSFCCFITKALFCCCLLCIICHTRRCTHLNCTLQLLLLSILWPLRCWHWNRSVMQQDYSLICIQWFNKKYYLSLFCCFMPP